MAEPARRNAAGPAAPGWGEYHRKMMACAQGVEAAVTAYLAAGGDDASPQMALAALAIAALLELGTAGRQADFGADVHAEVTARVAGQDRAQLPRRRGYPLRAVT